MTISELKNFFPFNPVQVYHKEIGYSMTLDEIADFEKMTGREIFQTATITHFTTIDSKKYNSIVIAYCE